MPLLAQGIHERVLLIGSDASRVGHVADAASVRTNQTRLVFVWNEAIALPI